MPTVNRESYPLQPCACGCEVMIAPLDAKGRPRRFVCGHNGAGIRRHVYQDRPKNYPRLQSVRIHRLRAEHALGKPLPHGVEVHHVDGTKREDAVLVICQDHGYHRLLHARTRILRAGGDPNREIICKTCGDLTPRIGKYGGIAERCPPCNLRHIRRSQHANS